MPTHSGSEPASALAWTWSDALRCGLCTLPAALIVLTGDPSRGLAWAVGILPAAVIGLAPQRRARLRLVSVGVLFALSILLGSLLIHTSVTAVIGIFAVAFGSALLASRRAFGLVAMSLCAPVAAVGLSYPDTTKALGLGLIILAGSVFPTPSRCCIPSGRLMPMPHWGRSFCLRQWPPGTASDSVWRPPSPPPSASPSTRTTSVGRPRRPSS